MSSRPQAGMGRKASLWANSPLLCVCVSTILTGYGHRVRGTMPSCNLAVFASTTEMQTFTPMYEFMPAVVVVSVGPSTLAAQGGSIVSVGASGLVDGTLAQCEFGGTVVVDAMSVESGVVKCMSVAGTVGNTSVRVSRNGVAAESMGYVQLVGAR